MAPRLEFQEISKRYGATVALDRFTLTVEPGEILGFVGPNGAGKSTAIHLALGFLRVTGGSGRLLGRPFGDARAHARLGFVPDVPVFFAGSAFSTVELAARLNGVRDAGLARGIREMLERVGLPETRKDVRKFSRGMQQRLALAAALVNDPDLLILDEPASALDPEGVSQVRELLRQARAAGKSIFFSSHQLTEVEQICDRIAFLHHGKLLRLGTLDGLLHVSNRVEIVARGLPAGVDGLVKYADAGSTGERRRFLVPQAEQRRAVEAVWLAGGEVVSLQPARRSLEEVFLDWSREGEA